MRRRRGGPVLCFHRSPGASAASYQPFHFHSMSRRVAVIQGHPDVQATHFAHALAGAYASAAADAGHEVRSIEIARLGFPLLRRKLDWESPLPVALQEPQEILGWAEHIVIFFPLWLGTMPALLKGFLEQVLRPGFAFNARPNGGWKAALEGKSARLVVTMGMPAIWYRVYFLSHGVRGLDRSILKFCGISPVRETFVGMVEVSDAGRRNALKRLERLGRAAR
jgi:putative NADPH-quinone reductase